MHELHGIDSSFANGPQLNDPAPTAHPAELLGSGNQRRRIRGARAHRAWMIPIIMVGGCRPSEPTTSLSDLFPVAEQSATTRGQQETWTTAVSPRTFAFPADHAAHEDYRIEWWYYTGNVESPEGRRFGYQLTFFRTGLHQQPQNASRWAIRDLYTTHFAVSDIQRRQHDWFQRNNRRGVGQAGAETDPYRVWNGDWQVHLDGTSHRLTAAMPHVAVELTLSTKAAPVLHGEQGLSRKGAAVGNASYYYSLTRMDTVGTIRVGDETLAVRGDSWMDHEFSTSFLEPGQLGWDWFAIQLDHGVDMMLYRMRRDDGSVDPYSSATIVDSGGNATHLTANEYSMRPTRTWKSPETGAVYPLEWRIEVPSRGYALDVRPAFDRQEMATAATTGISYWEGAILLTGQGPDGSVTGRGYMELTGYVGEGLGSLFD